MNDARTRTDVIRDCCLYTCDCCREKSAQRQRPAKENKGSFPAHPSRTGHAAGRGEVGVQIITDDNRDDEIGRDFFPKNRGNMERRPR